MPAAPSTGHRSHRRYRRPGRKHGADPRPDSRCQAQYALPPATDRRAGVAPVGTENAQESPSRRRRSRERSAPISDTDARRSEHSLEPAHLLAKLPGKVVGVRYLLDKMGNLAHRIGGSRFHSAIAFPSPANGLRPTHQDLESGTSVYCPAGRVENAVQSEAGRGRGQTWLVLQEGEPMCAVLP